MEDKSRNWCGLDTSRDAFDRVDWENGPEGMYLHSNCKMKLFNKRSLEQARKRMEKERAQREEKNKDDDQDRKQFHVAHQLEEWNRRSSIFRFGV